MENERPLVTVCIATYNAGKTIKETLLSVIRQTYSNIEIIVNDNCSSDNTISIIENFNDDRIRLHINSSNVGMSRNFDIAVQRASGEYVKLLCADDLIAEDCIETQLNAMMKHASENVVLVAMKAKKVIDGNGKVLFTKRGFKSGFQIGTKAIKKSLRKGTNLFGEPGALLYKREALLKSGGSTIHRELTYVFDLDLICRVLQLGNLYVIDRPLFMFRVVDSSYTAKAQWEPPKVFAKLIDQYVEKKQIDFSSFDIFIAKTNAWILAILRNMILKLCKLKIM